MIMTAPTFSHAARAGSLPAGARATARTPQGRATLLPPRGMAPAPRRSTGLPGRLLSSASRIGAGRSEIARAVSPRSVRASFPPAGATCILAPFEEEENDDNLEDLAIKLASARLVNLMSSCGTLKDDNMVHLFEEIGHPDDKIAFYMMLCSGMSGFAVVLTLINDVDPFGGINNDLPTLLALAVGAAAFLPLGLLHAVTWSDKVREKLPVLDVMLEKDRELHDPLIGGMTWPQIWAFVVAGCIPGCMLIHSDVQGGLTKSFNYYAALLNFSGSTCEALALASGVVGAAAVTGILNYSIGHGAMAEASIWKQRQVLGEAIDNAERFYSMDPSPLAAADPKKPGLNAALAAMKARAFREQALEHLAREEVMMKAGPLRAAGEAFYFGLVYVATRNMAAPLVCMVLYHFMYTHHIITFGGEEGSDGEGKK